MKTKNYLGSAIVLALCFTLGACENKQENKHGVEATDPAKVAEEKNENKFETRDSEKDADFMVKAAEINMEEIKLGQLAQQRGTTKMVKDLGKMMETDHTKTLGELRDLAAKKSISIPAENTEKVNEAYEKFNKMDAKDFDKEYCDAMVEGHKDAISLFEKEYEKGTDADIKTWASAVLPKLNEHLDHSKMCQEACEKKKK